MPFKSEAQRKWWSKKLTGKTCLDKMTPAQLAKMKSALDMQLQKMVQSFAAWGQYGQWIQNIITSPGADEDAWKRMLDAMKGGGGWPEYPGN